MGARFRRTKKPAMPGLHIRSQSLPPPPPPPPTPLRLQIPKANKDRQTSEPSRYLCFPPFSVLPHPHHYLLRNLFSPALTHSLSLPPPLPSLLFSLFPRSFAVRTHRPPLPHNCTHRREVINTKRLSNGHRQKREVSPQYIKRPFFLSFPRSTFPPHSELPYIRHRNVCRCLGIIICCSPESRLYTAAAVAKQ